MGMDELESKVQNLITTIEVDRKDREHGDRELSTKMDTMLELMSTLKSDQAATTKRLNDLPESVVSMRALARAVEANTSAITQMRSIAEDAHHKASRNDRILGWFIAGGITSFLSLVVWLIQSGAVA